MVFLEFLWTVAEAGALAVVLALDAFVASFAYGSRGIKIPLKSVFIINFVCTGIIGTALLFGLGVGLFIPETVRKVICFLVLFVIGGMKLTDGIIKEAIRRNGNLDGNIHFSFFNLRFVLHVYAAPEVVDRDNSQSIDRWEAISLAMALSVDGAAAGFGAAMGDVNGWALVVCSVFTHLAAILLGLFLGNQAARRLRLNFFWLAGVVLIAMAFLQWL